MSLPIVALIGRPNVGKSTLFKRLTKEKALVGPTPGLTRDRRYGLVHTQDTAFLLMDTAGFNPDDKDFSTVLLQQLAKAVAEADALIFMVDGKAGGVHPLDVLLADKLRQADKPLFLVVNKCEKDTDQLAALEFFALGLGEPITLSAAHGHHIDSFLRLLVRAFPHIDTTGSDEEIPKIAFFGKPNVGKSSLVNAMLGEERVVVSELPGTTRDAVAIPFKREDKDYRLIDTAGLRRKARIDDQIEKSAAAASLQALEEANLIVLVLDPAQGIGEQDATLGGLIHDRGKALVIAVNKWDLLPANKRRETITSIHEKLDFLHYAELCPLSALHQRGIPRLFKAIDEAFANAFVKLSTPRLTRILRDATVVQPPPRKGLFRPKLRYAHQGGKNPPAIVIHGNQLETLPQSYCRYLEKTFQKAFHIQGTPVRLIFRQTNNPYA